MYQAPIRHVTTNNRTNKIEEAQTRPTSQPEQRRASAGDGFPVNTPPDPTESLQSQQRALHPEQLEWQGGDHCGRGHRTQFTTEDSGKKLRISCEK
jgi:hypothetical protein